jgi:hypothetical protein
MKKNVKRQPEKLLALSRLPETDQPLRGSLSFLRPAETVIKVEK